MTSNQNFPITFKVSRSSLSLSDEFFSSWQILKPPDETHSFGSEVGILRGLASILKDTKHTRGRMQSVFNFKIKKTKSQRKSRAQFLIYMKSKNINFNTKLWGVSDMDWILLWRIGSKRLSFPLYNFGFLLPCDFLANF